MKSIDETNEDGRDTAPGLGFSEPRGTSVNAAPTRVASFGDVSEDVLRKGVLAELKKKKQRILQGKGGGLRPVPLWVIRRNDEMRDFVIDLYIIRHAEFQQDASLVVGGRSPLVPLTPLGKQQARALGQALRAQGVSFREMFACPILRCQETARLVCEELGDFSFDDVATEDALQEQSQGEWEGKRREEDIHLLKMLPRITALQPDFAAPGGESQRQVEYRMVEFVTQLALNRSNLIADGSVSLASTGGGAGREWAANGAPKTSAGRVDSYKIAMFSHSTAIKCLLRGILGSAPQFTHRIEIDHTSVTLLRYYALSGWRLGRVNDTSHLLSLDIVAQ